MKNATKKPATTTTETKPTMVHLCKTSYHYWRNGWLKDIFTEANITSVKWTKEKQGYDGVLTVSSTDVVKAKNALDAYKKKNQNIKDMWW